MLNQQPRRKQVLRVYHEYVKYISGINKNMNNMNIIITWPVFVSDITLALIGFSITELYGIILS